MNQSNQACFDDLQFSRFLENESDPNEEARILAHIATCATCQKTLEKLSGDNQVMSEIKNHFADNQFSPGEETHDHIEMKDRQRDLKKIQELLGPTDNPDMMGRLGGYEVCGMIGRGSAGVVVKALDTRLNRFVAIKLLAPVYSNNGSSRRRFEREGRAIASVKDPNVIPIHTVGDYQGTPYIVMQYVPDGSLHQRIEKKGPLSPNEVVCVGMQIAKGLAAAHKRGIVHRDVKPANVLMEGGVDVAMVTDFGLARVVDEATMTRSGAISGTPQYMSPEQAKGESVDQRSDLFSLGSVMYAACTGHSPFRAESVFGVIKRVCESEPRAIQELNSEVPKWLVAFISKLHAKRRDDRFETADQVAEFLGQELAHKQSPTMVAEPPRDWWVKPTPEKKAAGWQAGFAAAVGLAIVVGAGVFLFGESLGITSSPDSHNASRQAGDDSKPVLPMNDGIENNAVVIPDDRVGTMVVNSLGGSNVMLQELLQQNQILERFENTIEATIDVQDGGQLFMRSNLGTVNVLTHEKPTVEMRLKHVVKTKDQKTANKLFKALKLNYELDADGVTSGGLAKGKDAVIVAGFPTRKLTEKEIEESKDLEELKEQLLIRNNSHQANAEFQLLIPKNFSLDLETSAGKMSVADIDGWLSLTSHGGSISTGNVSGKAKILSHGGHINSGDIGADASIESHGGHVEVGSVNGQLFVLTHGGHIWADKVEGTTDVETHGGNVRIAHAHGSTKAKSHGGGITIWKAESEVDANAPSGTIKVNFIGQPQGDTKLKATSGSIRVGYLEGLGFDIDAATKLGKVTGPFVVKKTKELQHQLNDGEHKLFASTKTGSIRFSVINEDDIQAFEKEIQKERQDRLGQRAFDAAYGLHMGGKIDEAIEAHQHAATFESVKAVSTFNLGCAYALKGETDKAFAALNDAVIYGFDKVRDYEQDGDLESIRKDERFAALIAQLKEMSPTSSRKDGMDGFDFQGKMEVNQLASVGTQLINQEKFSEAESKFREVLEMDPENEEGFLKLGYALHLQGRLDEAYPWHEKASKTKNYAATGNYNLACVHTLRGEKDLAKKFLVLAIAKGFDVSYLKTDPDMDSLRDEDWYKELTHQADGNEDDKG